MYECIICGETAPKCPSHPGATIGNGYVPSAAHWIPWGAGGWIRGITQSGLALKSPSGFATVAYTGRTDHKIEAEVVIYSTWDDTTGRWHHGPPPRQKLFPYTALGEAQAWAEKVLEIDPQEHGATVQTYRQVSAR